MIYPGDVYTWCPAMYYGDVDEALVIQLMVLHGARHHNVTIHTVIGN